MSSKGRVITKKRPIIRAASVASTTDAAGGRMSNVGSKKVKTTPVGDGKPVLYSIDIAKITYPAKHARDTSFNPFIVFHDSHNRKFSGTCIPLHIVQGVYFAWDMQVEAIAVMSKYGRSHEMQKLVACQRKPLTPRLLSRLYAYHYGTQHNSAETIVANMVEHFFNINQLYELFPEARDQKIPQDELVMPNVYANLHIHLPILATYTPLIDLRTTCGYFGPEALVERVMQKAYGRDYKSVYSAVEIKDVKARLSSSPFELFFESSKLVAMPRLTLEHLYAVGITNAELTNTGKPDTICFSNDEISLIQAYDHLHKQLQQSRGTCVVEASLAKMVPAPSELAKRGFIRIVDDEKHPYAIDCRTRLVYDAAMYDIESRIVDIIRTLTLAPPERLSEHECDALLRTNPFQFDEVQRKALHKCIVNPFHVLSGKAGTGKSTVISALANVLFSELNYDVLVTTITGSVVEVIANMLKNNIGTLGDYEVFTENVKDDDDDDYNAQTSLASGNIADMATNDVRSYVVKDRASGRTVACSTHKRIFFKVLYDSGGRFKNMANSSYFQSNDHRKVAVIIDEANMFTNITLWELLIAAGTISKLILVGDPNQLRFKPEQGNPFCEIIRRFRDDGTFRLAEQHAFWTELQTNHRVQQDMDSRSIMLANQDAVIDQHPERIRIARRDMVTGRVDPDSELAQCPWTLIDDNNVSSVVTACKAMIDTHGKDNFLENTIIVTYRRIDVHQVNDAVFKLLFPGKRERSTTRIPVAANATTNESTVEFYPRLYKGERVVFRSKPNSSAGPRNIKNGTIGIITGIYAANKDGAPILDKEMEYVDDHNFTSVVITLHRCIRGKSGPDIRVPLCYFRPEQLERGYAATVHVFEGSQARRVLFYLAPDNAPARSYYKLMERELIYTAVTRATESVCIVARWNDFCSVLHNQSVLSTNNLRNKLVFGEGDLHKHPFTYPCK